MVGAAGVSVFDPDYANFNGGTLTAEITGGFHAGDFVLIERGSAISVLGDIYYDDDGAGSGEPIVIGSITADTGTSLTITLTEGASAAAVKALTEAFRVSSPSTDQIGGARQVTFTLHDGAGTANGGSDTGSFSANLTVIDNTEPVAGADLVNVRSEYLAVASTLISNAATPTRTPS